MHLILRHSGIYRLCRPSLAEIPTADEVVNAHAISVTRLQPVTTCGCSVNGVLPPALLHAHLSSRKLTVVLFGSLVGRDEDSVLLGGSKTHKDTRLSSF